MKPEIGTRLMRQTCAGPEDVAVVRVVGRMRTGAWLVHVAPPGGGRLIEAVIPDPDPVETAPAT